MTEAVLPHAFQTSRWSAFLVRLSPLYIRGDNCDQLIQSRFYPVTSCSEFPVDHCCWYWNRNAYKFSVTVIISAVWPTVQFYFIKQTEWQIEHDWRKSWNLIGDKTSRVGLINTHIDISHSPFQLKLFVSDIFCLCRQHQGDIDNVTVEN